MSCPMPEIGSCISLISKADIRYEGLLFTVDPDRCTIALARVKSYGTEDRETQFPIAPQNQCYDYILFRGSDIKDIRVINNNPVPNDPAIMQMHLPPQQALPPMQGGKLGQPGFQPQPGFMMPPMGPGGPGPMVGPPPGHQTMGQPYSSFGGLNNLGESVLDLIGGGAGGAGGSRSTTPSNLLSRKSPTVDMGVQTNQQQQQQQNRDGNRSGGDGAGGNLDRGNNQRNRNSNHQQQQQQQRNNQHPRERRDSGKNDGQMKENNYKNMQNMRPGGQNQNRGWINNRGPPNQNNSNNMRGRPRGRGGVPQGGHRGKNLLKFENDYDFEQANSKFEELRSQLSKLKVGEEVKPEQLNSETIDKKDDSGNETGAGEHEHEDEEVVCYDKTKSFFDSISCEAIERAKGKQQRTDWRQERKLNTETFGVGSTRRGGYNRRGGYYNRGPNNYRSNNQYRGGNNYRGRSGGNRNNQSNGLPHNTNNNGRLNTNQQQLLQSQQQQQQSQQQQQQQQSQQSQQSSQPPQQQQQPAVIEVAAGK